MTQHEADAAAAHLLRWRDTLAAVPVPPPPQRAADPEAAYRVQAVLVRLLEARGWRPIGYKLAATSAAARAQLNLTEPFHGRLFDATTQSSPAHVASAPDFLRVHEPEIALLVAQDLPAAGAPYDAAAIAAATAAVLPAFEIIGTCFTPWTESGATNLIADNAAHGRWIMGPLCHDFASLDLLDAPITLTIDGAVVATGRERDVDGGAFGATAWLAKALAAAGQGLRVGDYVTTGSVTPPWPVAPGQRVEADFGPLGLIALEIGR